MAKDLELKTNVNTPTADYPSGQIRNDSGAGDGTPVTEGVYGDFHQFFAKLLRDAGITANNLNDNTTNGFQYNQALASASLEVGWVSGGFTYQSGFVDGAEDVQYRKIGDKVEIRGFIRNTNTVASPLSGPVVTLPAAIYPNNTKGFVTGYIVDGGSGYASASCRITVAGLLSVSTGVNQLGNDFINLDNISYWIK